MRSPRRKLSVWILALAAMVAMACAPQNRPPATSPEPLPRGDDPSLVVLIVVDQLRTDYLERFAPVLQGGFARLRERGAYFTDAHQDHAETSTAPGHATISTGREPRSHGIIGNSWFSRATGLPEYNSGISGTPENLEATTLGDWMKAADPRSRVVTASGKDRSAIMLGGQRPDAAYWYDDDRGEWTSSSYYVRADKPWVAAFNGRNWLRRYLGELWVPLLDAEARAELDVVDLDTGVVRHGFPHAIGDYSAHDGPDFYGGIYDSPFVDAYLAEFARAIVQNEQLGLDGSPDLLGISFSALDTVGHDYGPHSPEALDVLMRLDVLLDELLDFLDAEVGLEHIVFALSSDHGVVDLPEVRRLRGQEGYRLGPEDVQCIQRAAVQLRDEFGDEDWLRYGGYLDHALIADRGLDADVIAARLAELVERCEAVAKAWTAAEIEALPPTGGTDAERRMRNNYYPGRSADVQLQLREYYLYDSSPLGTGHGSVYDYDSGVPILFAGPGIEPGTIDEFVTTADIAPTLAALLGIPAPTDLDGRDLSGDWRAGDRR